MYRYLHVTAEQQPKNQNYIAPGAAKKKRSPYFSNETAHNTAQAHRICHMCVCWQYIALLVSPITKIYIYRYAYIYEVVPPMIIVYRIIWHCIHTHRAVVISNYHTAAAGGLSIILVAYLQQCCFREVGREMPTCKIRVLRIEGVGIPIDWLAAVPHV